MVRYDKYFADPCKVYYDDVWVRKDPYENILNSIHHNKERSKENTMDEKHLEALVTMLEGFAKANNMHLIIKRKFNDYFGNDEIILTFRYINYVRQSEHQIILVNEEIEDIYSTFNSIIKSVLEAFDLVKSKPATTPIPNWLKSTSLAIKDVKFNPPATIVFWPDGTKTVVKAQNDEEFDPEKGLTMAITKKVCGNKGSYFNHISKWTEPWYEEQAAIDFQFNPKSFAESVADYANKAAKTLATISSE